MPEKDTVKELDNVYIQDPDTGELTKFEGIGDTTELEPDLSAASADFVEACKRLAEAVCASFTIVWERCQPVFDNYIKAVKDIGGDILDAHRYGVACMWAEGTHPEWTKILRRTKKTRIYEKYRKRIVREYLKQKEAEA